VSLRTLVRISLASCFFLIAQRDSLAQVPPIQAGQVIISELRFEGPNGFRDEFVEIYNNTDQIIVVQAVDTSGGWAVVTSNGLFIGPVCSIPNGTLIPARGHFLCANTDPDFGSGYSLNEYPSGNPTNGAGINALPPQFAPTTPNQMFLIADIPSGSGVALFATQNGTNQHAGTRLDAFGFSGSPVLFKEGNGFPTINLSNRENTYYRDLRSSRPQDTNDNAVDFRLVATTSDIRSSLMGAPGPENLTSPIVNNVTIAINLLDGQVPAAQPPNRERRFNPEPNADLGTMLIRRVFTNNSGAPVSRLRWRTVNITTLGTPASECGGTPCADVRALTSQSEEVAVTGGALVTVNGVRLEDDPPLQPNGGGLNASLSADFINLGTPLAAGASVNITFKLGVMRSGPFRFFVNIEAQNAPAIPTSSASERKKK
jgi:hypothetical protein